MPASRHSEFHRPVFWASVSHCITPCVWEGAWGVAWSGNLMWMVIYCPLCCPWPVPPFCLFYRQMIRTCGCCYTVGRCHGPASAPDLSSVEACGLSRLSWVCNQIRCCNPSCPFTSPIGVLDCVERQTSKPSLPGYSQHPCMVSKARCRVQILSIHIKSYA